VNWYGVEVAKKVLPMSSIARISWLSYVVFTLAAGCGGGGGNSPPPCPTIGVCTGFVGDVNWDISGIGGGGGPGGDGPGPGAGGDGDGGAAAGGDFGQFRRALVIAKFPDGSLVGNGSALTDDSGLVTIRPGKTYGGPLLLELHGQPDAVYFDEGKNTFVPFPPGQLLRSYIPTVTSNLVITPFTEAAYRLLTEGDTPERATGLPTRASVETANNKVREIINQQFPITVQIADLTRLPILKSDATAAESISTDARGAHSLITGAFSKQAAAFNPNESAPALTATKHLSEDLLDGHLDGMRSGQPIATADRRTYEAHTIAGELSSALAHQSFTYGTTTAKDAMPAVTNFGSTRYETYLFDAKLTPNGEAFVTVAGWDGANGKNRSTGDSRSLLPAGVRIQSVHGNLGHGGLFIKADSADSKSKLYAVGDNTNGELGIGTRDATAGNAIEVSLPGTMTHIAGGFGHTVARLADGSVYVWGDNAYGQLGQGSVSPVLPRSTVPIKVNLPRGALAVAATNTASYVLLEDGSVFSWGSSWGLGLLGDGTKDTVRPTPGAVISGTGALTGVVQIAARDNDAVVLKSDGSVLTWGSFPAQELGGFTGGRQVATAVTGLPAPSTVRVRKILTEQGLFVAQTTDGTVYHWGLHFDITAKEILRDISAQAVLNLPPVRDIMPGGFLGYGERPFDRLTAMGIDPNGGMWKIRGRVAELFDPANPTVQRRPKSDIARTECKDCHGRLPSWPIKAPPVTSTAICQLPAFKLNPTTGQPQLVNSSTECTMCHNDVFRPISNLNCVLQPPLPARPESTPPPITTNACQIPTVHVATPSGTVCASCHNSIIAQPLRCLPNTSSDPLAPTTRAVITSVVDNVVPTTGPVPNRGFTNDATPTINGTLSAPLAVGQSLQLTRNQAVVSSPIVSGLTWALTEAALPQGTYEYSARVVQGTSLGPLGQSHTITVDTAAPAATIATVNYVSNVGANGGVIPVGAITNDSTPLIQGTLSGPLSAGESVVVQQGGQDIGTATVTGTAFSFTIPTLSSNTYTFNVRVADRAGNSSSNLSRVLVVNIGSTLVPDGAVSAVNFTDDIAPLTGDFFSGASTNDTRPTLRGTLTRALIVGEQVLVYRAGVSAPATVTGTNWSFTPPAALPDGAHLFSVQIVKGDPAVLTSQRSAIPPVFTVNVDTGLPTTTVTSVTGSSDSLPARSLGQFLTTTNDNTPRVDIGLSAAPKSDERFQITRTFQGNVVSLSAPTATGSGTSFFFIDSAIDSTFASVGTLNPSAFGFPKTVLYSVRLVDAAQNQGPERTLSFTLNYPSCIRPAASVPLNIPDHSGFVFTSPSPPPSPPPTLCSSCHRVGTGLVRVPSTTPAYWCTP
jgi:alpha-tubulin suppressor-like RCC1 family protein